jgi:hypothetical protein
MADLDITIRRRNGAGYDVLHPTTIISQVTGLQTALDAKINTSARGAANGVAPLDSGSKVPLANLPAFITGAGRGFYLVGTISGTASLSDASTGLVAQLVALAGGDYENMYGYFWVASATTTLSWTDQTTLGPTYQYHVLSPGDEGDSTSPVTLEAGDVVVFTKYSDIAGDGDDQQFTFSIINNAHQLADTNVDGIVRLSDATTMNNLVNGVNHVVTENFLFDNKVADGSELTSATNTGKIAPAAHHHNGTYLAVGGNAATASALATARTIAASGDATWSVSFNGSADVSAALTLANSGVTAGTYKSVTVDAKGRVTGGTNPTTLAGYGISDAYTTSEVDTIISTTITNRPEIYYNAAGNSTGDIILDLDSDGAVG